MPRIIAYSNIKGGEGKTTLCRHQAKYSECMALRTGAIDLDPQGDLTVSLAPDGTSLGAYSVSSDLFSPDFDPATAKLIKVSDHLDLLPSTDLLDDLAEKDSQSALIKRGRDSLRKLSQLYDVLIIDTPTNAPICYKTGMAAAHVTVSPLQLDTYGMRGAQKFLMTSTAVRAAYNPALKHAGFVVNRFNSRSKTHIEMVDALRKAGFDLLPTILRERAAVQDALDRQMPVWSGPRGTVNRQAAREFRDMCAEVFRRAGVMLPALATN